MCVYLYIHIQVCYRVPTLGSCCLIPESSANAAVAMYRRASSKVTRPHDVRQEDPTSPPHLFRTSATGEINKAELC